MRRIEKGLEPGCMEELRQTPGADWSTVPGADKQDMRKQAWKEQYGLCAYCMSRLSPPSADGMKIEHFVPRAEDNTSLFDWSNLLGVCLGDIGVDGAVDRFHCDTHRGNLAKGKQALHVHPARFPPDAGALFSYTNTGEICPAGNLGEEERARVSETIQKLNLNIERLKRNRSKVIQIARSMLQKRTVNARHVMDLLKKAKHVDESGCLPEYVEVAVHYFEKKLRQV